MESFPRGSFVVGLGRRPDMFVGRQQCQRLQPQCTEHLPLSRRSRRGAASLVTFFFLHKTTWLHPQRVELLPLSRWSYRGTSSLVDLTALDHMAPSSPRRISAALTLEPSRHHSLFHCLFLETTCVQLRCAEQQLTSGQTHLSTSFPVILLSPGLMVQAPPCKSLPISGRSRPSATFVVVLLLPLCVSRMMPLLYSRSRCINLRSVSRGAVLLFFCFLEQDN